MARGHLWEHLHEDVLELFRKLGRFDWNDAFEKRCSVYGFRHHDRYWRKQERRHEKSLGPKLFTALRLMALKEREEAKLSEWSEPDIEDKTERARAERHNRKELGLCVSCSRPTIDGFARCEECRLKEVYRQRAKKQGGICTSCTELAEPGKRQCAACRADQRERVKQERERRKQAGVCVDCGFEPAAFGILTCSTCRLKRAQRRKRA